ncbi:helix-turn-helix domain-containing protein [Streptomyces sp. NBC_00890]|nr:helix-turn-helix domain-containing protein [Streptomyces sp. NBC_01423]WSX89553.1 helix-turn-helix domain-containing protein [Streptomyces sp. NBC_00891]WSY04032.1 helix-turn-helix domain-containing protein [Streptomyces sp. NBC_00890]WSZ05658.1 helix-turn-helix domain-containing protein [Streptomyces sp. NBC_00869]
MSPVSTTDQAAGARTLAHPAREDIRLEAVLHALSDPVRLCVVRELAAAEGELTCSCFDLPVTKSTTTHHFRVLRESGIVRQTYRGTAKMNGLRRDALEELFPGLLDRVLEAAAREAERLGES